MKLVYYCYGMMRYHEGTQEECIKVAKEMVEYNTGYPDFLIDDDGKTVMTTNELRHEIEKEGDEEEDEEAD